MRSYAQTNLQLYAELETLGASEADQALVARGYRLAAELFSGQYRGSGKPFVAHLVGTASILASLRVPTPVVVAGLLHAVYDQGDFGYSFRGRHADKRREVARVVGSEAEEYVQQYFQLRWTDAAIAAFHARSEFSPSERFVILIRLANELEDYLDTGLLFCANAVDRMSRAARRREPQAALARQLGCDSLAEELTRALEANERRTLAAGVRGAHGHSALSQPRSYRRRPAVAVRQYVARLFH